MELLCKILEYGSPEQLASVELRRKILRKPLGLDFTVEDLQDEEDQVHIACYWGNTLVGILLLKKLNFLTVKMRQVAVDMEMQGKGVGKAMVKFAEQWTLDSGCCIMTLHARETAVPFYLGLNYTIQGDQFEEVGIPHFKMQKEL